MRPSGILPLSSPGSTRASGSGGGGSRGYSSPMRVARMGTSPRNDIAPRPPPSQASNSSNGGGGSILPVLTSPAQAQVPPLRTPSPNAFKRTVWTTPRSPHEPMRGDAPSSSAFGLQTPPRRHSRSFQDDDDAVQQQQQLYGFNDDDGSGYPYYSNDGDNGNAGYQYNPDSAEASPSSSSSSLQAKARRDDAAQLEQLAYMEQMYNTIQVLNAELEKERQDRSSRLAPASSSIDDEVNAALEYPLGESYFDDPSVSLLVASTPSTASGARRSRPLPSQPKHPVPPSPSANKASLSKDQVELCATLGKNAELRIRSKEMEKSAEKASVQLDQAQKQMKMVERRISNREEKLRILMKEKLHWQKELKDMRDQVVEEKMRQVELFRRLETSKREGAAQIEQIEHGLRDVHDENQSLRAQIVEARAHITFQAKKLEDVVRQAREEREKLVSCIAETRYKFKEWKESEAAALRSSREQAVNNVKTEYDLKIVRHQEEKQKLREKVKDLEVSLRLMQKDRTLSPLELSLRKATILGSKDSAGTSEAEIIEAHSRIRELEALMEHSQEYQKRQDNIIKVSEATISRLVQEREVTALENLSAQPLGGAFMSPVYVTDASSVFSHAMPTYSAASSPSIGAQRDAVKRHSYGTAKSSSPSHDSSSSSPAHGKPQAGSNSSRIQPASSSPLLSSQQYRNDLSAAAQLHPSTSAVPLTATTGFSLMTSSPSKLSKAAPVAEAIPDESEDQFEDKALSFPQRQDTGIFVGPTDRQELSLPEPIYEEAYTADHKKSTAQAGDEAADSRVHVDGVASAAAPPLVSSKEQTLANEVARLQKELDELKASAASTKKESRNAANNGVRTIPESTTDDIASDEDKNCPTSESGVEAAVTESVAFVESAFDQQEAISEETEDELDGTGIDAAEQKGLSANAVEDKDDEPDEPAQMDAPDSLPAGEKELSGGAEIQSPEALREAEECKPIGVDGNSEATSKDAATQHVLGDEEKKLEARAPDIVDESLPEATASSVAGVPRDEPVDSERARARDDFVPTSADEKEDEAESSVVLPPPSAAAGTSTETGAKEVEGEEGIARDFHPQEVDSVVVNSTESSGSAPLSGGQGDGEPSVQQPDESEAGAADLAELSSSLTDDTMMDAHETPLKDSKTAALDAVEPSGAEAEVGESPVNGERDQTADEATEQAAAVVVSSEGKDEAPLRGDGEKLSENAVLAEEKEYIDATSSSGSKDDGESVRDAKSACDESTEKIESKEEADADGKETSSLDSESELDPSEGDGTASTRKDGDSKPCCDALEYEDAKTIPGSEASTAFVPDEQKEEVCEVLSAPVSSEHEEGGARATEADSLRDKEVKEVLTDAVGAAVELDKQIADSNLILDQFNDAQEDSASVPEPAATEEVEEAESAAAVDQSPVSNEVAVSETSEAVPSDEREVSESAVESVDSAPETDCEVATDPQSDAVVSLQGSKSSGAIKSLEADGSIESLPHQLEQSADDADDTSTTLFFNDGEQCDCASNDTTMPPEQQEETEAELPAPPTAQPSVAGLMASNVVASVIRKGLHHSIVLHLENRKYVVKTFLVTVFHSALQSAFDQLVGSQESCERLHDEESAQLAQLLSVDEAAVPEERDLEEDVDGEAAQSAEDGGGVDEPGAEWPIDTDADTSATAGNGEVDMAQNDTAHELLGSQFQDSSSLTGDGSAPSPAEDPTVSESNDAAASESETCHSHEPVSDSAQGVVVSVAEMETTAPNGVPEIVSQAARDVEEPVVQACPSSEHEIEEAAETESAQIKSVNATALMDSNGNEPSANEDADDHETTEALSVEASTFAKNFVLSVQHEAVSAILASQSQYERASECEPPVPAAPEELPRAEASAESAVQSSTGDGSDSAARSDAQRCEAVAGGAKVEGELEAATSPAGSSLSAQSQQSSGADEQPGTEAVASSAAFAPEPINLGQPPEQQHENLDQETSAVASLDPPAHHPEFSAVDFMAAVEAEAIVAVLTKSTTTETSAESAEVSAVALENEAGADAAPEHDASGAASPEPVPATVSPSEMVAVVSDAVAERSASEHFLRSEVDVSASCRFLESVLVEAANAVPSEIVDAVDDLCHAAASRANGESPNELLPESESETLAGGYDHGAGLEVCLVADVAQLSQTISLEVTASALDAYCSAAWTTKSTAAAPRTVASGDSVSHALADPADASESAVPFTDLENVEAIASSGVAVAGTEQSASAVELVDCSDDGGNQSHASSDSPTGESNGVDGTSASEAVSRTNSVYTSNSAALPNSPHEEVCTDESAIQYALEGVIGRLSIIQASRANTETRLLRDGPLTDTPAAAHMEADRDGRVGEAETKSAERSGDVAGLAPDHSCESVGASQVPERTEESLNEVAGASDVASPVSPVGTTDIELSAASDTNEGAGNLNGSSEATAELLLDAPSCRRDPTPIIVESPVGAPQAAMVEPEIAASLDDVISELESASSAVDPPVGDLALETKQESASAAIAHCAPAADSVSTSATTDAENKVDAAVPDPNAVASASGGDVLTALSAVLDEVERCESSAGEAESDRFRSRVTWALPPEVESEKPMPVKSRRTERRRTSRRLLEHSRLASMELMRDPTLAAYDVHHEQSQPFMLLDDKIFSIDPHARHMQHDENDNAKHTESEIRAKRKNFDQDQHRKSIAYRSIPAFNYAPVLIRFQWSDFVVATPISACNSANSADKKSWNPASPVKKMRLLAKKGVKLACGSYVIISAFIRPLEDGNENLRIHIYDSEWVEEFQYDFFEDHLKAYMHEWTGRDEEAKLFMTQLEFRREEGGIIIKLPDKINQEDKDKRPMTAPVVAVPLPDGKEHPHHDHSSPPPPTHRSSRHSQRASSTSHGIFLPLRSMPNMSLLESHPPVDDSSATEDSVV